MKGTINHKMAEQMCSAKQTFYRHNIDFFFATPRNKKDLKSYAVLNDITFQLSQNGLSMCLFIHLFTSKNLECLLNDRTKTYCVYITGMLFSAFHTLIQSSQAAFEVNYFPKFMEGENKAQRR